MMRDENDIIILTFVSKMDVHVIPQPMILNIQFSHDIQAIRQCRDGLLGNQSSCPAIREYFVTLLRSFLMLVPAVDPLPHYDAIELLEMIKAETDVYRRETYLSMLLDDVIGPENSDEDKSITVVNNTDDDNDSLAFSQGLRLE